MRRGLGRTPRSWQRTIAGRAAARKVATPPPKTLDFEKCDSREHSLGRDDKHGAEELDDGDDGESHAADEPTAVWDENALRAAGLGDLWKRKEVEPKPSLP